MIFHRLGRLQRYLIALVIGQLAFFFGRWISDGVQHAQICRIHEVFNAQFLMVIFSVIIYRRLTRCVSINRLICRRIVRTIGGIWLLLAHGCWLFFYMRDEGSWLALISFVSLALYIHTVFFVVLAMAWEMISTRLFRIQWSNILLRSESLHTMVALVLALLLTGSGLLVTNSPPTVKEISVSIRRLPTHLQDFRIVLLTDVHIGPTVTRNRIEQMVDQVNQLSPDIVAISGDLVDGFVETIGSNAAPLSRLNSRYGTFFATGNHEYYHGDINKWFSFLQHTAHIRILHNSNEKIAFDSNGKSYLCMAGVDDVYSNRMRIRGHSMNVSRAIEGCDNERSSTVLLVHQPNAAKRILTTPFGSQIDLILSGHTHGGQLFVMLPFAYLSQAYLHGLYEHVESGAQIYVSSGVNYWGPPVKMPWLCEISLIRLVKSL